MTTKLYLARFGFENGASAPGWTDGRTWNGFGVPSFDENQLPEAFKVLRSVGLKVHRRGPLVVIDDPESGTSDRYSVATIDGRRVWTLDGFTWIESSQRTSSGGHMRENRFSIPGWSVGYNDEISADAATRGIPGDRDLLLVMTTPEDRAPRSLDEEVTVGLYRFDGDEWEQMGYLDFDDVSSVIRMNVFDLLRAIEEG